MQSFPPPDLVSHIGLVLITDEIQAPADFLIHRFLNLRLKDSKRSRCVLLSVSEDVERVRSVASKSVRREQHLRHGVLNGIVIEFKYLTKREVQVHRCLLAPRGVGIRGIWRS